MSGRGGRSRRPRSAVESEDWCKDWLYYLTPQMVDVTVQVPGFVMKLREGGVGHRASWWE